MTNKEIENNLKVSLAKAIEKWSEENQELIDDIGMWHGDQLHLYMAEAATSVLMATKNVQDFMKIENLDPL